MVLNALYASLLERAQGISGLRHADIDWGQMQGSDEPPFPLPALFFNIEQIDWKELGGGTQEGTLRLYADLYVAMLGDAQQDAEALSPLRLLEGLHAAWHGFGDEHLQPLVRQETTALPGHYFAVRTLFSTRIVDESMQKSTRKRKTTITFNRP